MMKRYIGCLSVLFTAFLTACSQPPTVAVPKSPIHQIVGVTASITPTLTATKHKTRTLTPSPTATATFTPLPTSTPNPNPTHPPALESTPFNLPSQPITLANVSEIVELARWGNGQILDVRYSPDGTVLVVETTAGQRIFNGTTLEELPFSAELWQTAFPANEAKLEIRQTESGHELWKQGVFVAIMEKPEKTAYFSAPYAFSADGAFVAASVDLGRVGVWDATTGKSIQVFDPETTEAITCYGGIYSITFSADDTLLAASCYEGNGVYIWDLAAQKPINAFSSDSYFVSGLTFSPNRFFLAGAVLGGDVCLWEVATGILTTCFPESRVSFYVGGLRLAFSPNGRNLTGAFSNGEVLVWHIRNQKLLKRLVGNSPSGDSIAFSPDLRYLASAAFSDVIVWEIPQGQPFEFAKRTLTKLASVPQSFDWLSGPPGHIEFVTFTPDGTALIYLLDYGEMLYRPLHSNSKPEMVETVNGIIAFDITGKLFLPDKLSDFQDPSLKLIMSMDAPNSTIYAISPNRELIAGIGYNNASKNALTVQHLADNRQNVWQFNTQYPLGLTFSPDGSQLTFALADELLIWSVSDWTLDYKISISLEINLYALAYSPDGEILATGGSDGKIYLWEAKSGNFLRTLERHTMPIGDLAFSPEGKLIASTSADGTVRLWGVP